MQLLPALDVLDGASVRLERGDYRKILFSRPLAEYASQLISLTQPSLLHVVDLGGARDGYFDLSIIDTLTSLAPDLPLQVSGGLRSVEDARRVLDRGACRVIMGTAVFASDSAASELVHALGESLVVALDVKDGKIATRGWLDSSGLNVTDALQHCIESGVTRIHATAIERDGTMSGPDFALYETLCSSGLKVIAAGGVRDDSDLRRLSDMGCEAAVMGTALAQRLGVL
jgi:phosphoribosylformimino-5-aminoimidazole carboxamide ribotide isomerase